MSDCCARTLDARFDRAGAERQLRAYRRRGPARETRLLLDGLRTAGVEGASLLDIGGGIGALEDGLLRDGAARAVSVDASAGYLAAAQTLAQERGYEDRVQYRGGDFVELAGGLPPADVVMLDKVICCYPDMTALVSHSGDHAGRLLGAVYPVDELGVRAVNRLMNLMRRLVRSQFRTYIHPEAAIEGLLRERGLRVRSRRRTLVWRITVFERVPTAP